MIATESKPARVGQRQLAMAWKARFRIPFGGMEIRPYDAADWPRLAALLDAHWRAGHPITHRQLFDWQYRIGSGCASLVIAHENEIVGFLGAIPGQYFLDAQLLDGVALALWVVRPDLRDRGLGVFALRRLHEQFSCCICLGINAAVKPIYEHFGYHFLPRLNRYLAVLDRPGADLLLDAPGDDWPSEVSSVAPAVPNTLNPDAVADLFAESVRPRFRFGVDRDSGYWRWRYAASTGYTYRFFGKPHVDGFVVARIERCIAGADSAAHGVRVLRLIEIVPRDGGAWEGRVSEGIAALLSGVLSWGRAACCVLADFQHASARLGPLLSAVGFVQQPVDETAVGRVPQLFQPLRNASPINMCWRLPADAPVLTPNELYVVKSDGDMDRPNVWPLPADWGGVAC